MKSVTEEESLFLTGVSATLLGKCRSEGFVPVHKSDVIGGHEVMKISAIDGRKREFSLVIFTVCEDHASREEVDALCSQAREVSVNLSNTHGVVLLANHEQDDCRIVWYAHSGEEHMVGPTDTLEIEGFPVAVPVSMALCPYGSSREGLREYLCCVAGLPLREVDLKPLKTIASFVGPLSEEFQCEGVFVSTEQVVSAIYELVVRSGFSPEYLRGVMILPFEVDIILPQSQDAAKKIISRLNLT